MSDLNEFHEQNWKRMHEAFAPAHSGLELLACIAEELGEVAGALLGVTGAKKRKAHLTNEDVGKEVADAMTYVSLFARLCGATDLEAIVNSSRPVPVPKLSDLRLRYFSYSMCFIGVAANQFDDGKFSPINTASLFHTLIAIARDSGFEDWRKLLGDRFNAISERAESPIRTLLGQAAH